jgi:hypothetical protein
MKRRRKKNMSTGMTVVLVGGAAVVLYLVWQATQAAQNAANAVGGAANALGGAAGAASSALPGVTSAIQSAAQQAASTAASYQTYGQQLVGAAQTASGSVSQTASDWDPANYTFDPSGIFDSDSSDDGS